MELADLFKKILVFSEKIEIVKNDIFSSKDINFMHLFRVLDKESQGYITVPSLCELYDIFEIDFSPKKLTTFFSKLQKRPISVSTKITFDDFMAPFTPVNFNSHKSMLNSFIMSHNELENAKITQKSLKNITLLISLHKKIQTEIDNTLSILSP